MLVAFKYNNRFSLQKQYLMQSHFKSFMTESRLYHIETSLKSMGWFLYDRLRHERVKQDYF